MTKPVFVNRGFFRKAETSGRRGRTPSSSPSLREAFTMTKSAARSIVRDRIGQPSAQLDLLVLRYGRVLRTQPYDRRSSPQRSRCFLARAA